MTMGYRMSPEVHLCSAELAAHRDVCKIFLVNKSFQHRGCARAHSMPREPAPISYKLQTCPVSSQLNKTQRGLWESGQRQITNKVCCCFVSFHLFSESTFQFLNSFYFSSGHLANVIWFGKHFQDELAIGQCGLSSGLSNITKVYQNCTYSIEANYT